MEVINENDYRFPYWGGLLIKTSVSNLLKKTLLDKGKLIKKKSNNYNHNLVGAIKHEYVYKDVMKWFMPMFAKPLKHYEHEFLQSWQNTATNIVTPFKVKNCELWINYQKSKEFNPRHMHSGDLSFVIYLKIPKELIEENKKTKETFKSEGTGTIQFHHGEALPFAINTVEEMPHEGEVFIFPSWMQHSVTPFFSDVERISVAGNIILDKNHA